MIDVDFLFIYEIKNREIENICLLKYELEKRGYTTAFLNMWTTTHYKIPKYRAKVIVAFGIYDNSQAEWFPILGGGTKKLVNLQWEQLFTIADEESEKSICFIKEKAINAVHIAWGDFNVERLTKRCGVKEKNVTLAGHMTMDFLKPRFKGYYMDKKELCKQYSFDANKKIFLFISSFTYMSLPENEMTERAASKLVNDPFEQRKNNIDSQDKLLQWIKNTLPLYPDVEFVYRPHPSELTFNVVSDLEKSCPNFHVINDYSVKQWIMVSDKIYTWISTSVAEIYAAHKTCCIVRPLPINPQADIRIFVGCKTITKEHEFTKTFLEETDYPFDLNMLNYYYKIDEQYSYEIICDKLEEVFANDEYNFDYIKKEFFLLIFIKKVIAVIRRYVARYVAKLYLSGNISINKLVKFKLTKALIEDAVFAERMIINQVVTEQEIEGYVSKIKKVIESNT